MQEETAEQNAEIEGEQAEEEQHEKEQHEEEQHEEEQHEEEQHEEEQHDGDVDTKKAPQKTKRMNTPTSKSTITARLSKKRSQHSTSRGTPPKKLKLGGSSGPEFQ